MKASSGERTVGRAMSSTRAVLQVFERCDICLAIFSSTFSCTLNASSPCSAVVDSYLAVPSMGSPNQPAFPNYYFCNCLETLTHAPAYCSLLRYQKERVTFVQTVADLANRPQNVEVLQNAGVMGLLRPLLLDNVPSVQQSAALALGRLASHSGELAESVVSNEVLPQLVYSLSEQNRFHKKAAAFVLRAVAKHSAPLAQAVADAGALDSLTQCLEEFDPGVKEAAAWALGHVAGHTRELAGAVTEAGALGLLVLCVQEPDISLKRISASALSDIAKHAPELAQAVVDAGAVPFLAPLIGSHDAKLKRQASTALAHVAKHSADLAEIVVEAGVFPGLLTSLKDEDALVCKHAATCVREICKHTPDLAQLVVSHGGTGALTDFVSASEGNARLPGVMAIGFIAAFGEALSQSLLTAGAAAKVNDVLIEEREDHLMAASAWTLGQLGRHTPHHAKAVADTNAVSSLINAYAAESASDDLQKKCERSVRFICSKLTDTHSLDAALREDALDENLISPLVSQLSKVLPNDPHGRKDFVVSGGFAKIQHLQAEDGSELKDAIDAINSCYPPDLVSYYSPSYPDKLLEKLDQMTTSSAAA